MPLTIALPPEIEARLRLDAARERLPVAEIAVRRLQEAELLRRIFSYLPDAETRRMRSLVRKRQAGTLTPEEGDALTTLAHRREEANAARLADLATLASLRGLSLRQVMTELGIRPARME